MALLPKPYPDEVIGSVIARASWRLGIAVKRLLAAIYQGNRSYYPYLMTLHCRRLALLTGTDSEELILNHTVFPYAVAFMPPQTRRALLDKALDLTARAESTGSLTKNVSHGVPFRRLCRLCVRADLERYGESYWRRSHLLPGVLICPDHGEPLRVTSIVVRGKTLANDALLPHLVESVRVATRVPLSRLRLLAEDSVSALHWTNDYSDDWRSKYREAALKLGYEVRPGEVACQALGRAMRKFYGIRLPTEMGCPIPNTLGAWPALMVRPGATVPFATPKHLLLERFLADGKSATGDLTANYGRRGLRGRTPADYSRLDTRTVEKMKARVEQAATNNERLTVQRLLMDAGVWQVFRHNRRCFPESNAFIQKFRRSPQSERQIGRRLPSGTAPPSRKNTSRLSVTKPGLTGEGRRS
jgi:hypothetical protein